MPASATVLLPDGLPYEVAAPVICAGYTAWSALCDADPKPRERVAVLGIGGLGHLAVQFAKASGFETVFCSGGRRGLEIEVAPADLIALAQATVAPIAG